MTLLFSLAKNSGRFDLTCITPDYRQGASLDYMWEGHLAPMWERCPSVNAGNRGKMPLPLRVSLIVVGILRMP